MTRELGLKVRTRARNRCEYCNLPQAALPLPFQIDHIIAQQHEGGSILSNLALACPHCNRYRGPNIAGIDPQSGHIVRLYNPRLDQWVEHFRFDNAQLIGTTPIGRATIHVLAINAEEPLLLRQELLKDAAAFF